MDSQVELLALTLMYDQVDNNVRIDELDFVDVVSLIPYDSLFFRPSWKLKFGMGTFEFNDCDDCYLFQLNHGIGLAAETQICNREVYFAFLETDMNYAEIFERDFRLGAGVTIGVLMDITKRWKTMASGTYLKYFAGDESEGMNFSFQQRYTLNKNSALRLEDGSRKNKKSRFV